MSDEKRKPGRLTTVKGTDSALLRLVSITSDFQKKIEVDMLF